MAEDKVISKSRRRRGKWVYLAGALLVLVLVVTVYDLTTNRLAMAYEVTGERDPQTKILKGFEPVSLNADRRDRAVLMVHGFIGAPQNFGNLPQQIADAGWRVEAMNLPGCGTTPSDQAKTTVDQLESGVEARLKALQSECKTVVLMGHSQGAAVATLVAANVKPDGLVLAAPYFGLSGSRRADRALLALARTLRPVVWWLPQKGGSVNHLENADKVERYRWISSGACQAALETCEAVYARESWKQIDVPLLMIHSRKDKVTSPAATEAMFPKFASEKKQMVWIEKSNHVYFWDYDADVVRDEVLAFLKQWDSPVGSAVLPHGMGAPATSS